MSPLLMRKFTDWCGYDGGKNLPNDRIEQRNLLMDRKIQSLHHLRAVAAVAVVLYHVRWFERTYLPGWSVCPDWFAFGASGVELFFVISGFVMVVSSGHLSGLTEAILFFVRRCIRIYPLYWIATLATLAIHFWVFPLIEPSQLTIRVAIKSLLLFPNQPTPLLSVGWTLVFEMLFYTVFALTLVAPRRLRKYLLIGWAVALVWATPVVDSDSHFAVQVLAHPYSLLFLLGCVVGFSYLKQHRIPFSIAPVSVAVLIGGALIVYQTSSQPWSPGPSPGGPWMRMLQFGLPFGALLWSMASNERRRFPTQSRMLSLLGDASYSIYLTHLLVLYLLLKLLLIVGVDTINPAQEVTFVGGAFLTCLVVGVGVHRSIEIPLLRAMRKLIPTRR